MLFENKLRQVKRKGNFELLLHLVLRFYRFGCSRPHNSPRSMRFGSRGQAVRIGCITEMH